MKRRRSRLVWGLLFFCCSTLGFWVILPQDPQGSSSYDPDNLVVHNALDAVVNDIKEREVFVDRAFTRRFSYVPPKHIPGLAFDIDANIREFKLVEGGTSKYLKQPKSGRIWPRPNETEDRIISQINHLPVNSDINELEEQKFILIYNGYPEGVPDGRTKFEQDKCPVSNCKMTDDVTKLVLADAVVFQGPLYALPTGKRNPRQIWIYYVLESPLNVGDLYEGKDHVNWTASYRRDSTIVTPYERFVPFANTTDALPPAKRNYAKGKTDKVAWFVSNCYANNGRLQYAQELQKHISVHIYGECGTYKCYRDQKGTCAKMLNKRYKFYLAFENSNCQDYITEKLFTTGLKNDILPVVMGARPEDYAALAPPHSYIHVDEFESPADLAAYLHKLDGDDAAYNEYFRWKGTGEFIDTKYWCRLCSLVHEAQNSATKPHHKFSMWYPNLGKWWHDWNTCAQVKTPARWATWRNLTGTPPVAENRTLREYEHLVYRPWPTD